MRYRAILALLTTVALASPCLGSAGNQAQDNFLGLPEIVTPESNDVNSAPAFQDVLDVPATKSALATKTLLNGIVHAGNRLISVGIRGHIVYSDDGGKTWSQAKVPVSSDLTAVHFPTPQNGWAVGNDGIVLHSADGGSTWVKQFDGRAATQVVTSFYTQHPDKIGEKVIQRFAEDGGQDKMILDVWFVNETTGYIVGDFSLIFRTTDGGKTWLPCNHLIENPKNYHLMSIRQVGGELYICGERGLLLKHDPKTDKFAALKSPYDGTFFGITGKPGTVVAFGLRGHIYASHNAGGSWQEVKSGTDMGLMGGTTTEDGRIVLVSSTGQILVSGDSAASFQLITPKNPAPASAVSGVGADGVAVVGQLGVQVHTVK